MKAELLQDIFAEKQLALFDIEQKQLGILKKFERACHSEQLKEGIQKHIRETEEQIRGLRSFSSEHRNFEHAPARGMVQEADRLLRMEMDPELRDAAIVAAMIEGEHLEISAYSTGILMAKQLKLHEAVSMLERSLREERSMEEQLAALGQNLLLEVAEAQ